MWNEITEYAYWVVPLLIVAAVAVAHKQVWEYILCPLGRVVRWVVHFGDAWPVLEGIAAEFKPNHGTSLRDVVDRTEARMGSIEDALKMQAVSLRNIEQQLERDRTGGDE